MEILRFISSILFVYLLLLALRIILTWFRGSGYGRAWDYLRMITDPYLNLFRGVKFLHVGMFDFTPIAAILVLVILQNIVNSLSYYGFLTLGIVLGIIIRAAWSSFTWLLVFFAILCAIRAFSLLSRRSLNHPVWQTLDMMLKPLTLAVAGFFRKSYDYMQALFITLICLIGIWILGGLVINLILRAVFSLPV